MKNGSSDFGVNEFKPPLTIEKLCNVINRENQKIPLNAPNNTVDRLNELLKIPNFYDILKAKKPNMSFSNKITALVDKTKDYRNNSFSDLNNDEQSNIKRLNRLLLEETYPQETPKSLKNDYLSITEIVFKDLRYLTRIEKEIFDVLYYNRNDECNQFDNTLENIKNTANNILITGDAGVGKTSFVYKLTPSADFYSTHSMV